LHQQLGSEATGLPVGPALFDIVNNAPAGAGSDPWPLPRSILEGALTRGLTPVSGLVPPDGGDRDEDDPLETGERARAISGCEVGGANSEEEQSVAQMPYRVLGTSGIKVSEICLGAMMFGGATDEAEARRIVAHAADGGVNFIDTADVYA